jgi:glyoxylase-like metal-dependent hydrolase (beta-lactamase superfamily II)
MPNYICVTCGTQYPESAAPPAGCPICEDDRQYVNVAGQLWTTLDDVRRLYRNIFRELEPGVTAVVNERRDAPGPAGGYEGESSWAAKPKFGIGQQAHLIETPHGNLLWDCITLLDDETVAEIERRGGLAALGISHPHYYTTIVEWSRAFGGIPVYIHADDREWVMRPDPAIVLWEGETRELLPGCTMIRCGGHFPGAAVLHWSAGAGGRGALFSGDTIQVVADQRWVSFMYSYPNIVPLDAASVQHIVDAVAPYPFERVFGAFGGIVREDGLGAVRRSAERYIRHIGSGQ